MMKTKQLQPIWLSLLFILGLTMPGNALQSIPIRLIAPEKPSYNVFLYGWYTTPNGDNCEPFGGWPGKMIDFGNDSVTTFVVEGTPKNGNSGSLGLIVNAGGYQSEDINVMYGDDGNPYKRPVCFVIPSDKRELENLEDTTNDTLSESCYTCEVNGEVYIVGVKTNSLEIPLELNGLPTRLVSDSFSYCNVTDVVIPEGFTELPSRLFKNSNLSSITLPDGLESICSNAFSGCVELDSIEIPNSVTSIESEVFSGCTGLKTVRIGDGVASIGNLAFSNCSALTSLQIPNSVRLIGEQAFLDCSVLNDVKFGEDPEMETIADNAFEGCSSLSSVIFPNSLKSIGKQAFLNCSSLTSLQIPNSVRLIGEQAFLNCSVLNDVKFGETSEMEAIADNAFEGCSSLTSVILPNSLKSIGKQAFLNCTSLVSVKFGNSVETYGNEAFKGCNALEKVEFPSIEYLCGVIFQYTTSNPLWYGKHLYIGGEEVTSLVIPTSVNSIGGGAFINCIGIEKVVIPNTVTTIGNYAFYGCSSITDVTVNWENPVFVSWSVFRDVAGTLHINDGQLVDYFANGWDCFENVDYKGSELQYYTYEGLKYRLSENPEGNEAFVAKSDYGNLTSVTIPERITDLTDDANPKRYYVKGVENNVFYNCDRLQTVTFHAKSEVKYLGLGAFGGCKNLTSINIPGTVEIIGNEAFNECYNLASVAIPAAVKSIGSYAFRDCISLSSINIPNSVETIGSNAFYGCSSLKSVIMGDGVKTVGNDAFNFCSSLGTATFAGITSLCNIEFGSQAANPLNYAKHLYFKDNDDEVTSLQIPTSVTSIGNYAFVNAKELKNVQIPNSVKIIGQSAFNGCEGLETVTLGNAVESIGASAFEDCNNLHYIQIPSSVTYIGGAAFYTDGYLDAVFEDGLKEIEVEEGEKFYLRRLYWGRPIDGFNLYTKSLSLLNLGGNIESIPAGLFEGANNLENLGLGAGLKEIGADAFKGCSSLTSVVIPPMVETIGESAFENTGLKNVYMGHSVKEIGDKAFSGPKIQSVYITTQTPPAASNNTFSDYTGKLYLQGQDAVDKYYDAFVCWDRFAGYQMNTPWRFSSDDSKEISGVAGETISLEAEVDPYYGSMNYIFWRSTNPEIATVGRNGLVTLKVDTDKATEPCKIIASTMYAGFDDLEFTVVGDSSGITDVFTGESSNGEINFNEPVEVYDLNGVRVSDSMDNLAKGIYVVRQGSTVKKVMK